MTLAALRALVGTTAAAALIGGLALGSAPGASAAPSAASATVAAAPDASTVGGTISTSEVLARMKNWYDRKPRYSQTTYIWDLGHTREYRTDCSGFADMALHLNADYNTSGIASKSAPFTLRYTLSHHAPTLLNPKTVQTGDVFDDTINGHAIVFATWAKDGKSFYYYSFGGDASGVHPPDYENAKLTDKDVAGWPFTNYVVYRYKKIS